MGKGGQLGHQGVLAARCSLVLLCCGGTEASKHLGERWPPRTQPCGKDRDENDALRSLF